MEEAIQKVLTELKKIKTLHKNIYRPNVTGLKGTYQGPKDKEYGTIRKHGFPCESITFGITKFFIKKKSESGFNKKYPELYQSILELALYVIPDDFEMIDTPNICLNKNLLCLPHKDQNKGDSIIIGLGDYTGGRLILHHTDIDLEFVDIKNKPFKFNGKKIKHSTEPFEGDRWSIIFYS